jgi:hypothetical protein
MAVRIQLRRDTAQNWSDYNPTLINGELGVDTTSRRVKLGNGESAWNDLAYITFDELTMAKIPIANDNGKISSSFIPTTNVTFDSFNATTMYLNNVDNKIVGDAHKVDIIAGSLMIRLSNVVSGTKTFEISGGPVNIDGNMSLTGNAIVSTAPTSDAHLTNKVYVDSHITAASGTLNTAISNSASNTLASAQSYADGRASNAQSTAASYTDTKVGQALTTAATAAQGYASTAQTNAIASANSYTDGQIATEVTNRNNAINSAKSAAISSAASYTDSQITSLVDGAPGALNTLSELAAAINNDASYASTLTTALATKASKDSPTFTGNVTLPSTVTIGSVSSTELSYIRGVTSAIQTQLDAKANSFNAALTGTPTAPTPAVNDNSTKVATTAFVIGQGYITASSVASTYAPINGATLTGTVTLPSTTSIGTVTSTQLGYLSGLTSSVQTQIDAKAPINNPTFTGTVAGITKSMVGLGNVDNTSDVNKPISNATQTQLNTKLALTGGTLSGSLYLAADPVQNLEAATKQYVDGIASGVNAHDSVAVATTANLSATYTAGSAGADGGTGVGATLILAANGTLVIDEYTTLLNDRILVKDQTDAKQNGLYKVTTAGAIGVAAVLTRSTDYDNSVAGEVFAGDLVFVVNGTVNSNSGYVMNTLGTLTSPTKGIKIGTDNISWTQFTGASQLSAGTGLLKTGNQLSVNTSVIAPLANPTFTGTVTLPAGTVTSTTIADNTIVNADINSSAAIAATKIAGTAVTQADTGTVTNTMLAGSIANNKLTNSTISGIALGSNLQSLTIGAGLSGSSYNGSSAITIAIDSTVATLTGTQTLTNKTLTLPTIGGTGATFNGSASGALTLIASAAAGSGTMIIPSTTGTDTIVGKATTDTFTNKTFDTAGTGNVLRINGTQVGAVTGTGAVALAASPVFTTPTLGDATATSLSTSGNVTVGGNLTVSGTTTTINSTTLAVNDLNIEIGKVTTPSDLTANGGGITLKGTTDKTITYDSTNTNWTSSENWNIATGKTFKINNATVLSATALGSSVTGSSLTSVGTIATGVWQGSVITAAYIDSAIARLSSPTFTGTVTIPTASITGAATVGTTLGVTGQMTDHKSVNAQAGSYTLTSTDDGKVITMSGGGTLTIPSGVFSVGSQITIIQTGSSQVTIAGSGTTVNGTPGSKLRAQHSAATAIQINSGTWQLFGDLTA